MSSRSIEVDDLAALRWAMEPAAHPTEHALAYVVSGPDRDADGLRYDLFFAEVGGESRLVQRDARSPQWSPDGSQLAFARYSDDRWVPAVSTPGGACTDLPPPPGDVVDVRWGVNGRLLVVTTGHSQPDPSVVPYRVESTADWAGVSQQRTWIVQKGTDPIRVAASLGDVSAADWSPDEGQVVVVSSEGVDRDSSLADGLWLWSSSSDESSVLVPPAVPIHAVTWSPDGTSIAYLASAKDNTNSALIELWVLDVETKRPRQLGSELDRSVGKAVRGDDERAIGAPILEWAEDSRSVFALYADGGRSRVARFDLDGSHEDLDPGELCVLEFSRGRAGTVCSWSDPTTPGDLSWLDGATGQVTRVTQVSGALLSGVNLAPTEPISIVASDGVRIEGWLTLPPKPEGAPLVLQVHGGPHHCVGERFSFDAQRLAALGLAVLRSNPRGSQGCGQEFADGNLGDWGGRDLEDLLELIDHAVAFAGLDGERVAVIGESYGGYMAAWAAATTDRFAAAVVENGIADLLTSAGGSIGPTFWHSELGGAPWERPNFYAERSPITRIDGVSIPVLVIHCEADETCAIEQGEATYQALRQLGEEVEFWRVPDEGHFFNVIGALQRRIARTRALDEFLVKHLHPERTAQQAVS